MLLSQRKKDGVGLTGFACLEDHVVDESEFGLSAPTLLHAQTE
jgi:hypothetical protein